SITFRRLYRDLTLERVLGVRQTTPINDV
ncbi:MAG: hypothetical protein RI885_1297, partial [Actinomycetota bacterium]